MKRLTGRVWTLPNQRSYEVKHRGSSSSGFWTVTHLLGQYIIWSFEETNSVAPDLMIIFCSAIKYKTGLPGAGQWKGGP